MPAIPAASILRQLRTPDPGSRDVALLRTRLYRFSDDPRHYVLAEALEERVLAGRGLRPPALTYTRQCLTAIRAHGRPLPFPRDVAASEGIDVAAELAARSPHAWQHVPQSGSPRTIVVILGAPRSGTSHLFNLLARTRAFSYFTTASCWAWPVRNLHHPGRHLFTAIGDAVLTVDNKRTRVIPALVMPGEAEDIWARAIPAYRHIAGHRYEITPAVPVAAGQPAILHAAARAHTGYFGNSLLLAKSPFSSFRIPRIEELWGNSVRYIHIIRDQTETADSMRRNHFEFLHKGRLLSPEQARRVFTSAVREQAPADRLATVTYHDLAQDPARVLTRLLSWASFSSHQPAAPGERLARIASTEGTPYPPARTQR